MHRRLRRQLDEALGQQHESPPHLRKLFRKIDKEYRRADGERASLQHALSLLSQLLRHKPQAERRRSPTPQARAIARLFEQAPFALALCDADRKVTAWNAAAEQLFGIPAAEAVGRELSMLVFPDTDANRAEARTELRQILAGGDTQQLLRETPAAAGTTRTCEWTIIPLRDGKGRDAGSAALVQARDPVPDRCAVAWQGAGDGIWDWDLVGGRLWVSDSWRALVGATGSGDSPSEWLDRIHPGDREAVEAQIRAHLEGREPRFENEHRLRHEDGSWRWMLARGQATRDETGAAVRFSGATMDVTEPRLTVVRVPYDALTRLPNRAHFLDLARRSFARSRRRDGDRVAILCVDVDGFASLNAGLGRAAADDLLVRIGERLQACLREGDVLARQGGDEFSILLDDAREPADAEIVAQRIHEVTAQPFELQGSELTATVSIGIALSGSAYASADELLEDADAALHRARAQGRARSVTFDPRIRESSPELLELEADLRKALAREEFRVHYLPIVDVKSGRIQGLEALLRWAHPTRGMIAPQQFMTFAEETGLIVPIGRWLLQEAGREFSSCRRSVPDVLTLNVNLSSRQLQHEDLLVHLDGVLSDHGLDPADLVLELSETTLQDDGLALRLSQIRERGVRLSMDDFGVGSCSLNALLRMHFDSLKIDRSLFEGGSPHGRAPDLVRTIVSLARDLGADVVAEGVETAEQLGFVREVGCGAAQGFFFSPPLDGGGAQSLLQSSATW